MYIDRMRKEKVKSRQHPDFPGGHPPEYYPSLRLLNFTERTGYGVLSLRWPSTTLHVKHKNTIQTTRTTNIHHTTSPQIHPCTIFTQSTNLCLPPYWTNRK